MLPREKTRSRAFLAMDPEHKDARFCLGTGSVIVDGGDEKEVTRCINCDGAGSDSLTCTMCLGSGIQPRYLHHREFKDND